MLNMKYKYAVSCMVQRSDSVYSAPTSVIVTTDDKFETEKIYNDVIDHIKERQGDKNCIVIIISWQELVGDRG